MNLTRLLAWWQRHLPLVMPHAFRALQVHDGVHDWCPGWCPCAPDDDNLPADATPAELAAA